MQHLRINYKIIDKKANPKAEINRTAVFSNYKWTRDGILSRNTLTFGMSRTIPATERHELEVFANENFTMPDGKITKLREEVCNYVGKILDKDITDFFVIESATNNKLNILAGKTQKGDLYTEFYFGSGESSLIRMITEIEQCEDNSLILIEGIENGLHPLAARRLVEYLINVAIRKKVQVIFTTYSNEVLRPLPNQAVWICANDEIVQRKINIESLLMSNDETKAKMFVYVEDEFAQRWIETILSYDKSAVAGALEVYPLVGDGTAVRTSIARNSDPAVKYRSICYIDGDSDQEESNELKVYRLPGSTPESYVFMSVFERFDEISSKLAIALHQEIEDQHFIKNVLEKVWRETYDKHALFNSIAVELGHMQEETVISALLHMWCYLYKDEKNKIYNNIMQNFPKTL